jgi:UDP-glucose:(heptosyl)LPS alpha-1,3-glucosyltransferase
MLFLFVGNGFERKGVPRLLRAFAALSERTARLLVVGGDRRLEAARRLAERLGVAGQVTFVGPQQDVRPFYGAADAFALPTLYDPFPNAALEALACGLPLLVSTTCGVAELIDEGTNGYVRDALDIAGMTDALHRLAAHAPTQREAARAAAETLPIEAMAARLMSLYGSLAASSV